MKLEWQHAGEGINDKAVTGGLIRTYSYLHLRDSKSLFQLVISLESVETSSLSDPDVGKKGPVCTCGWAGPGRLMHD